MRQTSSMHPSRAMLYACPSDSQCGSAGPPAALQVAISVWQNSSDAQLSNWSRYAYAKWPFTSLGIGASTTKGKYKVGQSCNFWDRCGEG